MEIKQRTLATKNENGNIVVINGTKCSGVYCRDYGCDFPNCATFGEEFGTMEEAKQAHPNLELV